MNSFYKSFISYITFLRWKISNTESLFLPTLSLSLLLLFFTFYLRFMPIQEKQLASQKCQRQPSFLDELLRIHACTK